MDVVPLLAQKEEITFKSDFMGNHKSLWGYQDQSRNSYEAVEIGKMGQSAVKNNKVQDATGNDWSLTSSSIKCMYC